MQFKKGDLVTRSSYNNDTVFKIINIKEGIYYLKGVDVRLYANSSYKDLNYFSDELEEDNYENLLGDQYLLRNDYFYMPAKILHIDGDGDYLERCLRFYKAAKLKAVGKRISEKEIPDILSRLIKEYKPAIIIITGHDAYYQKKGDISNINNYKNSLNFVNAIKIARKIESSHEKLVIIAGACQSNYEELMKAGANFASSPKRINIHALDPAIIATTLALTERNKEIDLEKLLAKTKYKEEGMGGLKGNGLMYVGYPR